MNARLNLPPHERLALAFRERVQRGELPASNHNLTLSAVGLTCADLVHIFESQLMSRHLDYAARRLSQEKRGFYSIGSAGHEGNAGVAHVYRSTDMAFLHYRSAAFLIERVRRKPGATPLWDMALSFVASADDPVSGGRHKVLGSHEMFVPPQTSTIASHLPKAVGTSFAVSLARMLKVDFSVVPHDSVVIASFGDASVNHSTAVGALTTAALTAHRGIPLPILLICEDNGIGISVPTPKGWVAGSYEGKQGLHYIAADGTEILDVIRAARQAEHLTRDRRTPVFLHLNMIRLMGHAGSDIESAYRPPGDIKIDEAHDPLLKTARTLIDEQAMTAQAILDLDLQIAERVQRVTDQACERPKLTSAKAIMRSIVPEPSSRNETLKLDGSFVPSSAIDARACETPQHMSRLISLTLMGILAADPRAVVFGEDVGRKGGVYGATARLQTQFGNRRVFDTPLDEQSILGLAIGLAHNGFIPLPEIQFLAYVHNAEDQIRGEAATLSFFSDGKAANPMVIRIAGLAYQRGFGGHFHNDNALGVFRDIPGIVLACPSRGDDAVRMLRCCYRLARERGRVVIFLEPIALYNMKDLITDGDGGMSFVYDEIEGDVRFGELGVEDSKPSRGYTKKNGRAPDLAIVSYANGAYLSRRAIKRLTADDGRFVRLIDLRWLKPLDIEAILAAIGTAQHILVVDECRRTGSMSEELITGFVENECQVPFERLCAQDSFIPLGTAAYEVLPSEADILSAARNLLAKPSGQRRWRMKET